MRLIDADALENEVDSWGCNDYDKYDFLETIDNAPTVEFDESIIQAVLNKRCMTVVTNEHLKALHDKRPTGEWIVDKYSVFEDSRKCSNCNETAEWLDGGGQFLSNFCPNCGADMRGEENE